MKNRNRCMYLLLALMLIIGIMPMTASAFEYTDTYDLYGVYAMRPGEELIVPMEASLDGVYNDRTQITRSWVAAVDCWYVPGQTETMVTDTQTYYQEFLGAPTIKVSFPKPGIYNVCVNTQQYDPDLGYQNWKWKYLRVVVWDYYDNMYANGYEVYNDIENFKDLKALMEDYLAENPDGSEKYRTYVEIASNAYWNKFIFEESFAFPDNLIFIQLSNVTIPEGIHVSDPEGRFECYDLTVNGTLDALGGLSQCHNLTVNGQITIDGYSAFGFDSVTVNGTLINYLEGFGDRDGFVCDGLTVNGTFDNYGDVVCDEEASFTGKINMYAKSSLELPVKSADNYEETIQSIKVLDASAAVTCHFPFDRDSDFMQGFAGLKAVASMAAGYPNISFAFSNIDYAGMSVTSNLVIPANMKVETSSYGTGYPVSVQDGYTLTNNGTIEWEGIGITVSGNIVNNGTISTNKTIHFEQDAAYSGNGFLKITKDSGVADDVWTNHVTGLVVNEDQMRTVVTNTETGWTVQLKEISEIASGTCGENVTWKLMENGELIISGEGPMEDYPEDYPGWYDYRGSVKSLVIEDGVTTVGEYAFYNCSNIKEISLPSSITEIKEAAFCYCHALTEIALPDQLAEIGPYAFYNCSQLTAIEIPNGVTQIKNETFAYCYRLADVIFPNNLTEIAPYAFYECQALRAISLPGKLKTICEWAFYNCDGVTEVTIPASVDTIAECAFQDCNNLKAFTVEAGNTAFCNDDKGVLYSKDMTRLLRTPCTIKGSYAIPKGVTRIDIFAFWNCDSLTDVSIPASVTEIGMAAFGFSDALDGITVDSANPNFCSDAGFLFNKNKTELIQAPTTFKGSYTVPASVTTIGRSSFEVCDGLTEIKFSAKLKEIQDYAFWGCTALKDITFPGDAPAIGVDAFGEVKATCSYPAGNKTWTDDIKQNYAGTLTWKAVSAEEEPDADKKPATPELTVATDSTSGKPVLKWKKIDGAAKYQLYRKIGSDGKYEKIATVTGTSYTDKTAEAGIKYYYRMNAVSEAGEKSEYCGGKACTCDLAQPVVTASNTASTGRIKLSWNKVAGASKYYVYRWNSKTEEYDKIKTTTSTSYTDTTAVAGTSYTYRVTAVHENSSANSAKSEKVKCTCDLAQPVVEETNVSSSGKVKLEWQKIEGAVKYKIYRRVGKTGEYEYYKSTTSTTFTDSDNKAGTIYYYQVKAAHSNSSADSAKSSAVGQTCKLAQPEVTESNVTSSGKVKLEWQKIEGAEKYKIYRRVGKTGDYEYYKSTTSTTFTDSDNKAGTVYYYQVKAAHSNSSADSAKSDSVGQTCKLARPDVTIALSSGNPKLTWEKISGTTEYKVYRATSKDGTYKSVKTTTSTSFTDKDVKAGKTYYYKVKAIHSNSSANSAYSSVDSIKAK